MMKLPLTLIERILLANQLRILEKLEPEEGETYRVAREAIEEGYELDYDLVARQLSTDTMSEDECRFVHDVLEMYRHLTFSAKRADVPAEEIQFPGFDGNNETKYLGYVNALFGRNLWAELHRQGGYDSHSPMLNRYRRMLAIQRNVLGQTQSTGTATNSRALTADEIRQVLA
jgi:uncharacterized protein YfbU (UPF0304 family)